MIEPRRPGQLVPDHLQALGAELRGLAVGDYVTPETLLGYVGTTGNAAGASPHLHFGVYTADGVVDPLPLLADRPRDSSSSMLRT